MPIQVVDSDYISKLIKDQNNDNWKEKDILKILGIVNNFQNQKELNKE